MALPAAYTDESFAAFLHAALRGTATALGWSVAGGSYGEVANDALLLIGAGDVTAVPDIALLRAAGKLALWEAVATEVAGDYSFSADGGQFSRGQVHDHAVTMLAKARAAFDALNPANSSGDGVVEALAIRRSDVYAWPD